MARNVRVIEKGGSPFDYRFHATPHDWLSFITLSLSSRHSAWFLSFHHRGGVGAGGSGAFRRQTSCNLTITKNDEIS